MNTREFWYGVAACYVVLASLYLILWMVYG